MSKGILISDDENGWHCNCGAWNSSDKRYCSECNAKNENEMKIPSSIKDDTENINFRFPKRIISY